MWNWTLLWNFNPTFYLSAICSTLKKIFHPEVFEFQQVFWVSCNFDVLHIVSQCWRYRKKHILLAMTERFSLSSKLNTMNQFVWFKNLAVFKFFQSLAVFNFFQPSFPVQKTSKTYSLLDMPMMTVLISKSKLCRIICLPSNFLGASMFLELSLFLSLFSKSHNAEKECGLTTAVTKKTLIIRWVDFMATRNIRWRFDVLG